MSSIGSSEPRARDTGQQCQHEWVFSHVETEIEPTGYWKHPVFTAFHTVNYFVSYCRNCETMIKTANVIPMLTDIT